MGNSQNYINSKDSDSFDKKTLSIVHLLYPYVKQRLKVGEALGIFPRNMYKTNGIIDDVILSIYEANDIKSIDKNDLRLSMFETANHKLSSLFDKEEWHKDSISTVDILKEELKQLEERFTVDDGYDLIMNEELDDISYHQNDHEQKISPYDDAQENILTFLDFQDTSLFENHKKRTTLRKMYYLLPVQASNVFDLYILGKLNMQEIASMMKIDIVEVKKIMETVKEMFKKQLN